MTPKPRLLDLQTGNQCTIDEADWPLVQRYTVYEGTNGYAYISRWVNGASRPETLHSILVEAPKGAHIDHINGDKLDNRRENLRVVTPQRNQVNRKRLNRNNTSGVRGVNYVPHLSQRSPWRAQLTANGKNYYLGLFATKGEAIAARRTAELEHYGELCP